MRRKKIVAAIQRGDKREHVWRQAAHRYDDKEVRTKVLEVLQVNGVEVEGEREIVPSLEDVFIAKLKKEQ